MNEPVRVRVTGPPRHTTRRRARTREIDEETALGAVLISSLLRTQLRLAMMVLLPLLVVAAGLPLAFHLWPALAGIRLLGVPVPWLVLGVLVYPFLLLLGWQYVRRAERHEREFAELVEIADR
ncbi:hypothetical protein DDE18_13145 [Nocardioides gansuensis]|uniref:DUF485 domain-containing protein n=1 Tax=Nocardioides gansuensis TaxID=2138300 RepID=A0A2T8F9R3_9ACTN|nr:hypothetical protein [Nocardioides gansuensis]PVG82407.1 hypothetical protein DDE18_13145 [Nocardioides gansuensis]